MAGYKILAVDDSPTILKILEVILIQAGYEVHLAHDGLEGIHRAKEIQPDIIILDFIMPKMNGFQVCKAVRKDPDLKNIPIILMSAKGDKVGEKFLDLIGMIDYLTKPFSPESLLSLIPQVITKARLKADEAEGVSLTPPMEPRPITKQFSVYTTPEDEILNILRNHFLNAFNSVSDIILKAKSRSELSEIVSDVLLESINTDIYDKVKVKFEKIFSSGETEGISMKGLLGQVPLPEVFQFVKFQNHTGLLKVTDIRRTASVFMRGGAISFATFANPDSSEFIEQIFEHAQLDIYAVKKAIKMAESRNSTVIGTIIQEKIWERKNLYNYLDYITREVIYEILTWTQGSFSFHLVKEHVDEIKEIDLGIMMDHLVMDGLRRVDELRVMQQLIHSSSQVFIRNTSKPQDISRLNELEGKIYQLLDNNIDIGALQQKLNISTFDFVKSMHNLLIKGYIQEIKSGQQTVNQ